VDSLGADDADEPVVILLRALGERIESEHEIGLLMARPRTPQHTMTAQMIGANRRTRKF
jgi:hypothetical protein